MKSNNCGKKKHARTSKSQSGAASGRNNIENNFNTNLELFMSESEKMKSIELLIDKFLNEAMKNYLINEFEAGDIRFIINDYLTNSNNLLLTENYFSDEFESTDY